jgi:hypothetical protein
VSLEQKGAWLQIQLGLARLKLNSVNLFNVEDFEGLEVLLKFLLSLTGFLYFGNTILGDFEPAADYLKDLWMVGVGQLFDVLLLVEQVHEVIDLVLVGQRQFVEWA